ncbi:MAG: hypothetical protein V4658_09250 [Bacteroidota bacterium]
MDVEGYYRQFQKNTALMIAKQKKQLQFIVLMRLLAFLLLACFIYLAFSLHPFYIFIGLGVFAFAAFLLLMKQHARVNKELLFQTSLNAIAVHGAKPFYKAETGQGYDKPGHTYSSDFDVFGKGSLFQFINTTETVQGQQELAHRLLNPATVSSQIKREQEAIKELKGKPGFMTDLRTFSSLIGHEPATHHQLTNWLNSKAVISAKKFMPLALWVVPFLSIAGLVAAFGFGYYNPLVGAILINWFLAGLYLRHNNKVHAIVGKQKATLENYSRLNTLMAAEEFDSEQLTGLKRSFNESTLALKQLASLAAAFDQRLNTMIGPILNSLFIFDLQCVYRIEKWQQQHAATMQNWLADTARLEALVSFGTYAFNHAHYIFPEVEEGGIVLEATQLIHPLIGDRQGVANAFQYSGSDKVFIITGSNMSGKSTFLRTLGVSLLTGMMGLPVHAGRFRFSPVKLLSSMRIADSLQDSTSYFYAELKRLKIIVDETEKPGLPSVLFIDEMLKGTNSKEKLDGSVAIIEKLVTKPCISFIATHDLALGALEQKFAGRVKNYSFESSIIDNNLVFDYKIKEGVASSTNATFLLRKMGIV